MRTVLVDCVGVNSAAELWQRYIDAANPEQAELFGRNLDAFWDAVEHGGPGWPGTAKLVFINSSELGRIRLKSGLSLLDGLSSLAKNASVTPIELV